MIARRYLSKIFSSQSILLLGVGVADDMKLLYGRDFHLLILCSIRTTVLAILLPVQRIIALRSSALHLDPHELLGSKNNNCHPWNQCHLPLMTR